MAYELAGAGLFVGAIAGGVLGLGAGAVYEEFSNPEPAAVLQAEAKYQDALSDRTIALKDGRRVEVLLGADCMRLIRAHEDETPDERLSYVVEKGDGACGDGVAKVKDAIDAYTGAEADIEAAKGAVGKATAEKALLVDDDTSEILLKCAIAGALVGGIGLGGFGYEMEDGFGG
ncbi:MAG: hypothetical protein NTX11_01425 [Candidatus Saccharibacteria bacterium]|nr:hypothetical protein [Candidatus Saccharibacteria bacterium]